LCIQVPALPDPALCAAYGAHRTPEHAQNNRSCVRAECLRVCAIAGKGIEQFSPICTLTCSLPRAVAFDTGYAGSNGLEPQSWVNGNGTSYIYFGSGEFDGQGSGHDFYGTLYMPPSGYVNSCDGGRSHTYCDYRQE
jgi:hypothetical protein